MVHPHKPFPRFGDCKKLLNYSVAWTHDHPSHIFRPIIPYSIKNEVISNPFEHMRVCAKSQMRWSEHMTHLSTKEIETLEDFESNQLNDNVAFIEEFMKMQLCDTTVVAAPTALCHDLFTKTHSDDKLLTQYFLYVLSEDSTSTIDELWSSHPVPVADSFYNESESVSWKHGSMFKSSINHGQPPPIYGYAAAPNPITELMMLPRKDAHHVDVEWLTDQERRQLESIHLYYQGVLIYESFYQWLAMSILHPQNTEQSRILLWRKMIALWGACNQHVQDSCSSDDK